MGKVAVNQILRKVMRAPRVRKTALFLVQKEADKTRRKLLTYFNNHYITRKLEEGPDPDEQKNLYGFIGFYEGTDPIGPIRTLLENSFKAIKRPSSFTTKSWTYRVRIPSEEKLKAISPLPWLSESWLEAVEKGIPGLVQYLNKKAGNSGAGVQVDSPIKSRKAEFEPRPYLLAKLKEIRSKSSRANAIR